MSKEVYTYKRIRDLPQLDYWNEIKEYPQITVSWGLKRALKSSNHTTGRAEGILKKDPRFNAVSFKMLQEYILPNWTTQEARYGLFAMLSAYITGMIRKQNEASEDVRKLLKGCKNNRTQILYGIELLEEANVNRSCFDQDLSIISEMTVFLRCWDYISQNTHYIKDFREAMNNLAKRSTWNDILSGLFGIDSPENVEKIVFHGFYYFTPLQRWIVDLAEKAGFGIVFLFPYDQRYKYVYETWKHTYSGMEALDPESWRMEATGPEDLYADIFSGRNGEPGNTIKIHEYRSIVDFSKRVAAQKNVGVGIFSPTVKVINDSLMVMIPEEYGKRKLLSYPVGKFLLMLCNMWDEVSNGVVADEKCIFECFASGWLNDGDHKGQNYLYEINQIMPFFRDCTGIDQWKKRIDDLEQVYQSIIPEMQATYDKNEAAKRWQAYIGNPLSCFSQFSLKPERVSVIIGLMRKLFGLAEELFESSVQVPVKEFVNQLLMVLDGCRVSEDVYLEEQKIANEILGRLANDKSANIKVYPYDAAAALGLYLNDDFSDEDVLREKSIVKNLFDVDTADITHSGKVHLCMCDSEHMPGGKKQYPWPFSRAIIYDLIDRHKCYLLKYMVNTIEKGFIANRYFFYAALQNKDVELSWIHELGNKQYIHSCYLDLVNMTLGIKIPTAKGIYMDKEHVADVVPAADKVAPFKINFYSEQIPKEAKMDYVICPIKYVYNHVLDCRPSFNNEFHQSYIINALAKAISSLCGTGSSETIESMLSLFPQLSESAKSQIIAYVSGQDEFQDNTFAGMTKVGNKYFTEERLKAYFSDKPVRDEAIKKYGEYKPPEQPEKIDFNQSANGGENEDIYSRSNPCLFCQFQEHCRNSIFISDVETLYDKA
jgi:hypothetical protein